MPVKATGFSLNLSSFVLLVFFVVKKRRTHGQLAIAIAIQ
jgi:hypothetical protein